MTKIWWDQKFCGTNFTGVPKWSRVCALWESEDPLWRRYYFFLFLPCVYFSPRRTLPRVLNFYIDPKRFYKDGDKKTIFTSGNIFLIIKNYFGGPTSSGTKFLGVQKTVWSNILKGQILFFYNNLGGGPTKMLADKFWGVKNPGVNFLGGPKRNWVRALWEIKDPLWHTQYFGNKKNFRDYFFGLTKVI